MILQRFYLFSLLLLPLQTFAYQYGNPSAAEQAHLEDINRARANPVAEAQRICQARSGSSLCSGVTEGTTPQVTTSALPPLTFNSQLYSSAKQHSQDMINRDFFDHTNPDGLSPFDRIRAVSYPFAAAAENIAYTASTVKLDEAKSSASLHDDLFEDDGYPGRGHRVNILSDNYKEVGVGLADGQIQRNGRTYNAWYVTANFGRSSEGGQSFITGVAYNDTNGNGVYDAGEGLADVQITTQNGEKTTTATAGGYGLPLNDGSYTLTIQHPSLGSTTRTVNLAGQNVKLDIKATDFSTTQPQPDPQPNPEPDPEPQPQPDPEPNIEPQPTPDSITYATMDLNTAILNVPVVNIDGQNYEAKLQLVQTEPAIVFMLVALQPTALSPTSESVQFSLEGQWYMLTMPKIFMPAVSSAQQDTTFGAKFALINFEPALFQLVEWL